jgi:hypothetical protein
VTDVSPAGVRAWVVGLRGGGPAGEDAAVFRTLLEPFWPGRRAHAYDQFCR